MPTNRKKIGLAISMPYMFCDHQLQNQMLQLNERRRESSRSPSDAASLFANNERCYKEYRTRFRQAAKANTTEMRFKKAFLGSMDELSKILEYNQTALDAYKKIGPAIAMPYMFCDHANKSFENQYTYLRRTHPELFAHHHHSICTLTLAQHPRLGAASPVQSLPQEMYKHIHAYARETSPHEFLLRSMAFAANQAFDLYSD
jgi:hypothetical protein